MLGTTQVIPVPTAAERQGIDTTTFPGRHTDGAGERGNPARAERISLPNEPTGPFGDRTYATSSKVVTRTDQFSIRVDHKISDKASLLTRFSLNQVTGPLTNPDQTAIDPSFGSAVLRSPAQCRRAIYADDFSAHDFGDFDRLHSQHAIFSGDQSHSAGDYVTPTGYSSHTISRRGSIFGSYGNLYQFKQDMAWMHAFAYLSSGAWRSAVNRIPPSSGRIRMGFMNSAAVPHIRR